MNDVLAVPSRHFLLESLKSVRALFSKSTYEERSFIQSALRKDFDISMLYAAICFMFI